jgi:hypothetical protein
MLHKKDRVDARLFLSTFSFYKDCVSVERVPGGKMICNFGLRIKMLAFEARNDMLFGSSKKVNLFLVEHKDAMVLPFAKNIVFFKGFTLEKFCANAFDILS